MKVLSALTSILVISASLVGCMGESEEKEDIAVVDDSFGAFSVCLLYTSPSPRDQRGSRMPSSA